MHIAILQVSAFIHASKSNVNRHLPQVKLSIPVLVDGQGLNASACEPLMPVAYAGTPYLCRYSTHHWCVLASAADIVKQQKHPGAHTQRTNVLTTHSRQ